MLRKSKATLRKSKAMLGWLKWKRRSEAKNRVEPIRIGAEPRICAVELRGGDILSDGMD